MANYSAPSIIRLGSVHEQTLTESGNNIYKTKGNGDTIYVDGVAVVEIPTGGS